MHGFFDELELLVERPLGVRCVPAACVEVLVACCCCRELRGLGSRGRGLGLAAWRVVVVLIVARVSAAGFHVLAGAVVALPFVAVAAVAFFVAVRG